MTTTIDIYVEYDGENVCTIRASLTEVKNLFRKSHTIFWLILLPKAREASIEPIRKKLYRWILRFQILMLLWDVKNSKCANPYKRGLDSFGVTRGFQMWSQNLNRITFDPLFVEKKTAEN